MRVFQAFETMCFKKRMTNSYMGSKSLEKSHGKPAYLEVVLGKFFGREDAEHWEDEERHEGGGGERDSLRDPVHRHDEHAISGFGFL